MSALLTLEGLGKDWFGVPAVEGLTLSIAPGEVLGLIGENGAGKSTLMNMIGGVVPPTRGRMLWEGQPYAPASAADATAEGVAFIHQELNLFGNLSIAENILIDGFPRRMGLIDRRAMARATEALMARLDLDLSPDRPVGTLVAGEKQLVEIAKALHRRARLIIFDEPTTSLTTREIERLFSLIDRLRAEGTAMIYISHILGDVVRVADRVAVLRDGSLVGEGPVDDFPVPRMIHSMIGRELADVFPPRRIAPPDAPPVLEVEGLSAPGVIEDVSLTVREGEVVGLFGLMGAGRSELARILFGLDPAERGRVRLGGQALHGGPRERIAAGMGFVTENRREEGLMMDASVRDNLALAALGQFAAGPLGLVDREKVGAAAQAMQQDLRIKAADLARQPVRSLSGGNQQKVVLGKWLLSRPHLLILDEPTRGVDVGARAEIYAIVNRLAEEGCGVLMISSELDELKGMCDRIAVMRGGEITGERSRAGGYRDADLVALAFGEQAAA
ncbi:ATP-binding cassette domain-containing protein [Paracoccus sp. S-4012]|uniref:sugar ABC transporter ATP-binding protein n=1 Tax=Paracoccus sp. S-4012 TaxID=2665648 RepID=UPI0012AEF926|nr:sugar ABC transporter ATP-binding protein [Paracoccus sp. S-4012]MRX52077.1 ATP-binding cassette domain-containing protein [Paracoccus sp. S-4012]